MSLIRLNRHPSARQLRVFAVAWLCFAALLGFAGWRRDHVAPAVCSWVLGAGVLLVGLGWPAKLRLLYLGLCYLTLPVGLVVSWLTLVLLYYGVLTPLGLILRLCGHDALGRRFDPPAASYWRRRSGPRSPDTYFRQH